MALWVRVVGKSGEVWGPYPDDFVQHVADFARIGSRYGRHQRDVIWQCGRNAWVIRRYEHGERVFPEHSNWRELLRCMKRCARRCVNTSTERPPQIRRLFPARGCPCTR